MNIDKTRKVVSIVLMVLMIGTLVFNAFHIVGHCADDNHNVSVISEFPLPYGNGEGLSDSSLAVLDSIPSYQSFLDWANNNNLGYINTWDTVLVSTDNPLTQGVEFKLTKTDYISFSSNDLSTCNYSISKYFTVAYVNGSYTNRGSYYSTLNIVTSYLNSTPTGIGYTLKTGDLYLYPLYSTNSEAFSDYFAAVSSGGGGHSKGGSITEYTFDQTDEAAPTDPSAVAGSGGWLSKILGGLNKLNKTVGDGFKNLVDNFQSFFNPIFGAFEQQIDSFKSSIEGKLDDIILALGGDLNTSDTSLSDTFLTAFQGSKSYGVVTTYNQGKGLVSYLFNAVPTPQTLRFEFDLPTMNLSGGHSQGGSSSSNAVKPYGNKLVMDFGWYENVRSIVVPFIIAWLYAGMLIWLLRAIPGFISGSPSINTRSVSDGSPIINGHNEVFEYTDFQGQHHRKPIFRL